MQATRTQAAKIYNAALAACRKAEQENNEQAWLQADATLTEARKNLVAAEIAFPTYAETAKASRILMLRNRGLDA